MIINQTKLSPEIKDKYKIVSNSFCLDKIKNAELDKYDGKPKDELNVIVGDDKETDFIPQIKLCRWSNETNFSVRLKHNKVGVEKVETIGDKVKWSKGNIDIEFYDYEGGYKMVWYLKKKPKTNKVEFTIQSKGLDFFYQPELTQEEKDNGAFRPENVVGSYAVYHQTKGGMNDINGKDYKVGKAGHIYRPKLTDAEGKEEWGILHIDKDAGTYEVEIPQDFLDKAVYPIKSNDEFGYQGEGGTDTNRVPNDIIGGSGTPSNSGDVSKISGYFSSTGTDAKGILVASNKTIVGSGINDPTAIGSLGWYDLLYSAQPSVIADNLYYPAFIGKVAPNIVIYYDSGQPSGTYWFIDSSNNYDTPTDPTDGVAYDTYRVSIYATYTPAVGADIKSINGVLLESIKSVNSIPIANIKSINGVAAQ